jgi:glycosyltransferase involved in cell wall biosynthesis
MNSKPNIKIYVVVPSYIKDFDCILPCVKNLSEQTIKPQNIIVCVSEITNEHKETLDNAINDLKLPVNVIIHFTTMSQNASANRNRGIEYCLNNTHPDYIMFCDCDDVVHTKKIESFIACLEYRENINIFVHSYSYLQVDFDIYSNINLNVSDENLLVCYNEPNHTNFYTIPATPVHHAHLIVKTELCRDFKYNESFHVGEDGDFCQRINKAHGKSYSYNEKLINYIV